MGKAPENPAGEDLLTMIVNSHRLNNGFVCPYAQMLATVKTLPSPEKTEDPHAFYKKIEESLLEFLIKKTASLILVLPEQPKNHEEGRAQTENIFDHLRMAALSIRPGAMFDPRIKNRKISILPFGSDKLLVIGLNQLYPEKHPRYSPEPIVTVTKISDVLEISDEQTFEVRKKAIRRLIQTHIPHISLPEIESQTTIEIVEANRKLKLVIDVDDSISTPEMMKAIHEYGMQVPLYLMPDDSE